MTKGILTPFVIIIAGVLILHIALLTRSTNSLFMKYYLLELNDFSDPGITSLLTANKNSSSNDIHRQQNQQQQKQRRLMVIAAVPKDERHLYTLWTELECFTQTVDTVVISVPDWSAGIIEPVVDLAKRSIPHFTSGRTTILIRYFVNDRYDVGLWCDGLRSLDDDNNDNKDGYSLSDYDEYGLLNDSVFALRLSSEVFDVLHKRNLSLSSMSYSLSAKYFAEYGNGNYWVESIFRGFNRHGLNVFRNYSCVPATDTAFCPTKTRNERKDCVVNYFEHDLATQFQNMSREVYGLYLSDVFKPSGRVSTWAIEDYHWRQVLVQSQGFPIAKANRPKVIREFKTDPLLKNCTRYLQRPGRSDLSELNLDFSSATDGLTVKKNYVKKPRRVSRSPMRPIHFQARESR
jgi:hypothetical protein